MDTLSWLKKRKIAVLYGGLSSEAAISRKTGKAVLQGFKDLGLNVTGIDAGRDLAEKIKKVKPGFCFIALHGKWGEDGTVQGILDVMGIPYSGSGVLASALSMNKYFSKRIFLSAGIPTAPYSVARSLEAKSPFYPCVVKPVDGGSAIGVTIVRESKSLRAALKLALRESSEALLEKFIGGREVTVPVLGEKVLPLIEIVPKRAFYDFKAKYEPGMSDHIMPARISDKTGKDVERWALAAHRALNCKAFSRVDFIVDKSGKAWVLELNSIPGMTETSLFPEAARAAGFSFPEMLLEIVRNSL